MSYLSEQNGYDVIMDTVIFQQIDHLRLGNDRSWIFQKSAEAEHSAMEKFSQFPKQSAMNWIVRFVNLR